MKKRLMAAFLTAALLLSLFGCAPLFKTEYLSVTEYQDGGKNASDNQISSISTYEQLKDALIDMVNKHQTEGRLRFIGYNGALQTDINQARLEIMGENALASFSVSSLTYDLSPIVTYYEAVIKITYKRSQSEIADILYITGRSELPGIITDMLEGMESHRALRIISATVTAEEVTAMVVQAFEQNPASSVVSPIVQISIHPEKGLHRIIEVELEYGWKLSELQRMKGELSEKIEQLTEDNNANPAQRALTLYNRLSKTCAYDPTGAMRSHRAELDSGLGETAYGALVEGLADSRGMAFAYSALCHAAKVGGQIVNGSKDGEAHSWNLVKVRGLYYHVDPTVSGLSSLRRLFMRSDETMAENGYEWDREAYPECSADIDESEVGDMNF